MTTLANQWGPTELEYPNGMHAAGVAVTVKNPDDTIATLYTDKTKATTADNPVSTDSLGNLKFWAEPGEYNIEYSSISLPIIVSLHPDEMGDAPRVIKFNAGWPARGTNPRPAFFIGGSAATDEPTDANLANGDLWFPATA